MATDSWLAAGALSGEERLAGINLPVGVTLDDVALAASQEAWRRTGRIYGVRVRTNVRFSAGCGCGCCPGEHFVDLGRDVVSVQAVKVDGVTLPSSAYELIGNRLWRQDGRLWPGCQSGTTPLGQPGTWSVDFTAGHLPPPDGVIAVRELAIHRALRLAGKASKTPARTTSVSRQGTTVSVGTSGGSRGFTPTGVPLFDDFVSSVNPRGYVRRSTISSPDVMSPL